LRLEEFAFADVVGALAGGTFARPTREGRLVWRVPDALPLFRTDRVKLKEIVQNLVDNALKHTEAAVTVEVDVAAEDIIRIAGREGGRGTAGELLPRLFEPFRPGAGASAGSGFGLYIARCFVDALGGRLAVRSDAAGTTFSVELPREFRAA